MYHIVNVFHWVEQNLLFHLIILLTTEWHAWERKLDIFRYLLILFCLLVEVSVFFK